MSVSLEKINILQNKFEVVLEKKNIVGTKSQIVLVLDSTGSMRQLYKNDRIQGLIERIYAVASKLDDDGFLDLWIYDVKHRRLPQISLDNLDKYVDKEILGKYGSVIFRKNNEPPVMKDIVNTYSNQAGSNSLTLIQRILVSLKLFKLKVIKAAPVFVIFITDGGVKKNSEIKEIIVNSCENPLFWQFVGFGKANYGILKELDTLGGRAIDNSGFFEIDDYEKTTDEELYERLMGEFPDWLKKTKNMVLPGETYKLIKQSALFYCIYFTVIFLILILFAIFYILK